MLQNSRVDLDLLNLLVGLVAFITNITYFCLQLQKRKVKLEQLEAVYAFGCAITGLGFAIECDVCTMLWRGNSSTQRMWCFLFAPSSTMYIVGQMITYVTMLYMVLMTAIAFSPKSHKWIMKSLSIWEFGFVIVMPVLVPVCGCWIFILFFHKYRKLTTSCFFRVIVPQEFISIFNFALAMISVVIAIIFFCTMCLMHRRRSVSSEVRLIQMRRKARFYKKVSRLITFAFFALLLPCWIEFSFNLADYNPGDFVDYIWVMQPFCLAFYATGMIMKSATFQLWKPVKRVSQKLRGFAEKHSTFSFFYTHICRRLSILDSALSQQSVTNSATSHAL